MFFYSDFKIKKKIGSKKNGHNSIISLVYRFLYIVNIFALTLFDNVTLDFSFYFSDFFLPRSE